MCLYEVYEVLKREAGKEKAPMAIGYMKDSQIIPVDEVLALHAADISTHYRLAMADSIIYATGITHQCEIITSDADFEKLPDIKYLPKIGV